MSDYQSFTATKKCTSRNEKTGRFHKILAPNLYVRVFPNGDVLYRCILYSQCYCGQSHQQSHHNVTRSSSLFIVSELTQTGTVIICLTIPTRGSLCNNSNHLAICEVVIIRRDIFYGLIIIFARYPRLLSGCLVHYYHYEFSIINNQ